MTSFTDAIANTSKGN